MAAAVDREHPLFAIYQAHAADPVVVLTLSSAPDNVSVLDASIDATAAATASDAASWARHLLTRAATLITPAIEGRWRGGLNRDFDWTEGSE
ncbi:MAG TPA: hypothetical protein VK939_00380 [Longimicrobiales bacterium]|nr:hypothetical protein [Longimicrobiales bacterium]